MITMINVTYYIFYNNKNEHNHSGDSTNGAVTTGQPYAKNEDGCLPHTVHRINSKWIRDLNV